MGRGVVRASAVLGVVVVSALAVLGVGAVEAGAAAGPLRVGCGTGSFSTIGAAITAAVPNQTVAVCAGTYHESVVVPAAKPLTILSGGGAIINAAGLASQGGFTGIEVLASGTTIEGLTVENAYGEGILVEGAPGHPIARVTIANNTITHNDRGNPTGAPITTALYPECNAADPTVPGDCGEGVHLMVAANATVVGNRITTNSGGVLVTDEFGPSHGNMIEGNIVNNNTLDCGVTLAGHNPNAVSAGSPEPTVAGVFNNTVQDNLLNGNGVAGQGAGVVLASPLPGGGVYGNRILDNQMAGNGLAGVTLHSHAPGQDLNGNIVMGNTILRNNLDGDPDFFPIVDPSTTGVIVATTPAGPVGITVSHNLIENDVFGIWTTPAVTLHGATSNQFLRVTTPVFQAS